MPALIIAGITVEVVDSDALTIQRQAFGGEDVDMWDGSSRTTKQGLKPIVPITTPYLVAADASALRAVLNSLGAVVCSGDLLGGSGWYFVQDLRERPKYISGGIGFAFSFVLRKAII